MFTGMQLIVIPPLELSLNRFVQGFLVAVFTSLMTLLVPHFLHLKRCPRGCAWLSAWLPAGMSVLPFLASVSGAVPDGCPFLSRVSGGWRVNAMGKPQGGRGGTVVSPLPFA